MSSSQDVKIMQAETSFSGEVTITELQFLSMPGSENNEQISKQIEQLEDKIVKVAAKLEAEKEEHKDLKQECSRLRAENRELRDLKQECSWLRAENGELRVLKKEHSRLTAENRELSHLKQECRKLTAENEVLRMYKESSPTHKDAQIRELKNDYNQLNREYANYRKDHNREVESLQASATYIASQLHKERQPYHFNYRYV